MSSENVKDACNKHDLVTPCYDDVNYKGPECHITGTDYTLSMLSAFFCGRNRNYQQCPVLFDVFIYMFNWNSGSACGVIAGKAGCQVGNGYMDKFSLCAFPGTIIQIDKIHYLQKKFLNGFINYINN